MTMKGEISMSSKIFGFLSRLAITFRSIHLVDRCLLIFLLVLLLQSAGTLLFSTGEDGAEIDVIVRTTSAAIFGYFLSSGTEDTSYIVESQASAVGEVETSGESGDSTQVQGRIGFVLPGDTPSVSSPPSGATVRQENWNQGCNSFKIRLITGISAHLDQ